MTTLALPFTNPPHALLIEPIVLHALEEDLGRAGDITSDLIIPASKKAKVKLAARKPGTIAGLIAAECAFRMIDPDLKFTVKLPDGSQAKAGALVATIEGSARSILTAYKVPRRIFVVDELPKSLIGKVLRRQVKEKLESLTSGA